MAAKLYVPEAGKLRLPLWLPSYVLLKRYESWQDVGSCVDKVPMNYLTPL